MEERITKEELLERLFHDDYENLKGRRLRLTRVRVPGKELSFAHVFTPNDRSIYENLEEYNGLPGTGAETDGPWRFHLFCKRKIINTQSMESELMLSILEQPCGERVRFNS